MGSKGDGERERLRRVALSFPFFVNGVQERYSPQSHKGHKGFLEFSLCSSCLRGENLSLSVFLRVGRFQSAQAALTKTHKKIEPIQSGQLADDAIHPLHGLRSRRALEGESHNEFHFLTRANTA